MKKRFVAVVLASVVVAALSACASSGSSTSGSSDVPTSSGGAQSSAGVSASDKPATGTPIVFGTDGSDHGNGFDQYQFQDGFVAWAKQASENGGLGGRPVTVDRCNDQGDPVQSSACARQQIADPSIIASMGFSAYSGYSSGPLYKAAGMAYVQPYPVSSADFSVLPAVTDPGSLGAYTGLSNYLAQHGYTKFGVIRDDLASTEVLVNEIKGGLVGTPGTFVADIPVALATTDYSSAISQAIAEKADVLLLGVQVSAYVPIFEAAQSQGYTGAFGIPGNAVGQTDILQGQAATGATVFADADFPDTSSNNPTIVSYRAAMAAAGYPSSEIGQASLSGYETGLLFGQVVKQIGPDKVTRASFLKELSTGEISGVPLFPASAGANSAPSNARSVINPDIYVIEIKGGKPQQVSGLIDLKSVIENVQF